MDSEFKMCNHCGETYFTEHIDKNGNCKLCNGSVERYKVNEISNIDD